MAAIRAIRPLRRTDRQARLTSSARMLITITASTKEVPT
jgi:hypothetical protein